MCAGIDPPLHRRRPKPPPPFPIEPMAPAAAHRVATALGSSPQPSLRSRQVRSATSKTTYCVWTSAFRTSQTSRSILAYAARSSSAIDNLGNYYDRGHAGGRDQSTQGIGVSESEKADPSFVLQPGESRSAVFNVIRYRPGNAELGISFTYSLTIQQLQVLPSRQIRTVRDFSLNYPDIVPAGFSPAKVNDGIRKIGEFLKKKR